MKVVVLLSGGLDSTVLTGSLLSKRHCVHALSVDYGQRHRRELGAAAAVAAHYRVPHEVVPLPPSLLRGSALTGGGEVPNGHYEDASMRATVVPSRNLLLLSLAASVAVREGADAIAYAAHGGDHAIYPDCRPEFITAVGECLRLCDYRPLQLVTPFAKMSKADVVLHGYLIGAPLAQSWTCYTGGDRHCGRCGSCVERREAFKLAGVGDPTEYDSCL